MKDLLWFIIPVIIMALVAGPALLDSNNWSYNIIDVIKGFSL